jgi:PAS domain S-box-containing protein
MNARVLAWQPVENGVAKPETDPRLAAIVESAEYTIVSTSLEGRITSWNPAAERTYGYTALEAIGKPIFFIVPADHHAEVSAALERLRRGERVTHYETIRRRKDGRLIHVDWSASPIRDASGQLLGAASIARDITERKQAEEALRVSEAEKENIISAIQAGLIIVDAQTHIIVKANAAALKLIGLPKESVLGQRCHRFICPAEAGKCPITDLHTVVDNSERVLLDGSGKRIPILKTVVPITFEQRQCLLECFLDLSDRKRAEALAADQAQELARSNKELEQFAYVASHDLQEPLRMITSYVQLLARRYQGQLSAEADEFISFAVDGATRMQQLINDLLGYSRVGSRGGELAAVACETVLAEALTNLGAAIQTNRATVTHDSLPVVMADHSQLVQLFQNLIGNAIKFHSQSPPCVHVSAQAVEKPNCTGQLPNRGTWRLAIKDNGIGIEPQFADRIFVVFQRLHTSADYPGTGIGLAVCKKIVERHGGRIWVESEPGKGATFFFTLSQAPQKGPP